MYLAHFGLDDWPFRLTPSLDYRFDDPAQAQACNVVRVALDQGAGFIKVTGEVGLGKTLLCRRLLSELNEPFLTAWLPDPHVSPGTLRAALARDLGVPLPSRPTQQELHHCLQRFLTEQVAAGRKPVFLIDEAQALSDNALETVRLLTNLETEQRKLLQVVLFGQPELDRRLARPELRQLRQRIVHSARLEPLDRAAVERYVDHRIQVAGGRGGLFTPAAIRLLARASGGTPRLINVLADKALLAAYGRGGSEVSRNDLRRAVSDTESTRDRLWWPRLQPAIRLASFCLLALVTYLAMDTWLGAGP